MTSDSKVILHSYYRSSCSYRVRIALNLKKIPYSIHPVNLLKGEMLSDEHKKLNPKGEVPVLIIDGKRLMQSIPIIEYIDETYKDTPQLLPEDSYKRYQARMISEIIASGIQPLQNLSVLKRVGDEKKVEWARHFITAGLDVVEKVLEECAGKYCVGDEVSMADCCLIPQLYNARRFQVDLERYPIIMGIEKRLNEIEAFQSAHPNCQIDCPEEEMVK